MGRNEAQAEAERASREAEAALWAVEVWDPADGWIIMSTFDTKDGADDESVEIMEHDEADGVRARVVPLFRAALRDAGSRVEAARRAIEDLRGPEPISDPQARCLGSTTIAWAYKAD